MSSLKEINTFLKGAKMIVVSLFLGIVIGFFTGFFEKENEK